ncbi:UDP-3-O-(3-hydroxymyristoyl)glucosamine N-acyltransferase [Gammaproteobacteria bacterium]|nr:UDP-3-O-(3-hydroxymyristoyl)glucosamine N-acyltransferase [Gammaproteobacteria bacterium]
MRLKKKYSLEEISSKYNCKILGNSQTMFEYVSSIFNSKDNSIAYINDMRSLSYMDETKISCIIATSEIASKIKIPVVIHENPQLLFIKIIKESYNPSHSSMFSNVIDTCNKIDPSATIGINSVIGKNVTIGKSSIIYPNVTIYDGSIIGDNVIIQSGAVIGSDGFGLIKDSDFWIKVPHIGNVVIANNVEIGANTTIDKGTIDSTIISDNVKIDNLVHVAHNVTIGKNTAIAACVGIAGSTSIGENCTIGGGSGLNGHICIADNVHIHGMTMVTKSIKEAGMYASGTTVEPADSWRKNQARFKELDALAKSIKKKI